MSLRSERISLVTEEDFIHSSIQTLSNVRFGPCSIASDALAALRLALKSHSTGAQPKEVIFALLGKVRGDRWHISQTIQLIGANTPTTSIYSAADLRKIETEAASEGLSFIGILHSHPQVSGNTTLQVSAGDKLCYLVMLEEFRRPIFFFVVNPQTFELGWISLPLESFLQLQESVKFQTDTKAVENR